MRPRFLLVFAAVALGWWACSQLAVNRSRVRHPTEDESTLVVLDVASGQSATATVTACDASAPPPPRAGHSPEQDQPAQLTEPESPPDAARAHGAPPSGQ